MKKRKIRKFLNTVLLISITAIISAILTMSYINNKTGNVSYYNFSGVSSKLISKISMVKEIIDKKYIENEVDEEQLIESAVKGYVEGLGDEYTEYFTVEEMEEYTTEIEGSFVGIGIYMALNENDNTIVVLYPIKGSSAEEAGIQTGDIIRKVDDIEYTGDDFETIASNIKGKEGTKVKIEVERNDERIIFNVERRTVDLNPIETEVLENNIGYISISSFDDGSADEFNTKYNELAKQNISSLIIDLRNNGGGILDEATQMASLILDKDSTILITKDKDENIEIEKNSKKPSINVPIVILTNENTASASEVFTAALKENGKATIVGTKTYGKGVIQQLITLPDKSGIKITIQEYFTPNENKINKIGTTPDVEAKLPDNTNMYTMTREEDTQLQTAINVLKNGD